MGRKLRVTADHPVVRYTYTGFDIALAEQIQPGDQILTLKQLPGLETAPNQFNLIELLRGTALADDVLVSPTDDSFTAQYTEFGSHVPATILKYPHDIKRHNRMSLRLYYYLVDNGWLNVPEKKLQLYTAKGAATNRPVSRACSVAILAVSTSRICRPPATSRW